MNTEVRLHWPLAYWFSVAMLAFLLGSTVQAAPSGETREIIYSGEGLELKDKAAELITPAAMYEYVRNTHDYALYHGSRSNSINTYLGQRGSDVDLASVLIAMYRSQNIPARYATAKVSAPATKVANWLKVTSVDLAAAIMNDQGIQNVVLKTDAGQQVIEFEQVWVQVLVVNSLYRGGITVAGNCSAESEQCVWVDVDPSWKQHEVNANAIDLYRTVNFNYDQFYNALKNNDPIYRDKNPLEIYEDLLLNYLKANRSGKTLKDIPVYGSIIKSTSGLLPASLPYKVLSTVQTYDSISAHDDVASVVDWAKYLDIKMYVINAADGTSHSIPNLGYDNLSLADLSTKRLVLGYENTGNGKMVLRIDGQQVGQTINLGTNYDGVPVQFQGLLHMVLEMDGTPATYTNDQQFKTITAEYTNLAIGGYFLIGTGGYTSNWSQVHRASKTLLQANQQYSIVYPPNEPGCQSDHVGCTPYLDVGGNGYDAGDTLLLNSSDAQNALTAGLLDVAMNMYMSQFADAIQQHDALDHTITPIAGLVGVVSSTYEVEYLDGTAFSIMPGGLLIDMGGQAFNGSWRIDQGQSLANEHVELLGHIMSSFEHEVWQELTSYDAISTVRGIQMGLARGLTLLNASSATLSDLYDDFGFSNSPTTSNTYSYDFKSSGGGYLGAYYSALNKKLPGYKSNLDEINNPEQSMEVLKKSVTASTSALRGKAKIYPYAWEKEERLTDMLDCFYANFNALYFNSGSSVTNFNTDRHYFYSHPGGDSCWGVVSGSYYDFVDPTSSLGSESNSLYAILANFFYYGVYTYNTENTELIDYFDMNSGYVESEHVFRSLKNIDDSSISADEIIGIRDDLLLTQGATVEYVMPNRLVSTGFNYFLVEIKRAKDGSGNTVFMEFLINNAGGGFVDDTTFLSQAESHQSTSNTLPTYNNEYFTDDSMVSQTNNDLVKTPSTADPVSTVTGNMYHDETDFTIKGRGLAYAFTRSYNSAPARSGKDGPLGYGWTHSYAMKLQSNDWGKCSDCTSAEASVNGNNKPSSITYVDERGGEHTYILNADTSATRTVAEPPPGEFDKLTLNTPSTGKHTLTFRNGVKYVFEEVSGSLISGINKPARLAYIEDPWSTRLTMGYDASNRLISVMDNLGIANRTGLTFTYSGSSSHIQSVRDWTGRTWQFGYQGDNLATVTNPLSQAFTYNYHSGTHLLKDVVKPESRNGQYVTTTFTYYENDKAFDYTNQLGHAETLDYDLYRQSTRVTDPRGFVREYFYDNDNGALLKLEEPDGAVLRFENTADGLRYKKIDGLNYETQYSYLGNRTFSNAASNNNGLVSREVDPLNQHTDYFYGLFDQITTVIDKKGTTHTQNYYAADNGTSGAVRGKLSDIRVSSLGGYCDVKLASFTYYTSGAAYGQLKTKTEYIDPANSSKQRITDYIYEANGINVQSVTVYGATSGTPATITYTYDNLGRKLTETVNRRTSAANSAPIALTTTFTYDSLGRVLTVTNPRGDIAESIYDKNGQVYQTKTHYKNSNGTYTIRTTATNSYNAADQLVETMDVLGYKTTYTYDPAGNLETKTDANVHTITYEYDNMNRQNAVIDANGRRTEMHYDLGGRLDYVVDGNGKITDFDYDALGRRTKSTSPEARVTQMGYDANDNLQWVLDADATANSAQPKNSYGYTIYNVYDELNRQTKMVDALNGETRYTFDLLGNITQITDAENQVTTFVYDDMGRLTESHDSIIETPTDKVDKITLYDELGNVLTSEDRSGRQRRFTYDTLNRLTSSEYLADSTSDSFGYDAFGDLVTISNVNVTYTYTYSSRHEMKSKTDSRLNKSLN